MSKICNRNDGRKWRCSRPAFEDRTLCEKHYLQGKLRQNKEPVPDDLKFERQPHRNNHQENDEIRSNVSKTGKRKVLDDSEDDPVEITQKGPRKKSKKAKKSKSSSKSSADMSEDLDDTLKKMNLKKGDLQLDLIRGYLNSQAEKKKGKQPQKEDIVKEFVSHELRLKREAAEKAFEAWKDKDDTIKSLEELRFLALSTKDLSDDDAFWIERKKNQIKAKLRAEMSMEPNNEDDSDE